MEIMILAGLILLNGLFAMSEVALLTSRRTRLATLAKQGDPLAAAAARLVEQPTRFLSTVQIGITTIGLLNGIVGEAVLAAPFAVWLEAQGLEPGTASWVSTALVVVAVTYVSIVVGELVPKRLGQHNAEGIARLVAWPMRALALLSGPFVHLLTVSTDAILAPLLRLFGVRPDHAAQEMSAEEIRTIVLESSKFMPKKHVSILMNLFELGDITVHSHLTVHGAGANLTEQPRWAYILITQPGDVCWNGSPCPNFDWTTMKQWEPFGDERFPVISGTTRR